MADLKKWARETAPNLGDRTLQMLHNWEEAGMPAGTEDVCGFTEGQCRALLARVQELADSLSAPMLEMLERVRRGMRGMRNYYDSAGDGAGAHHTARALVRRGLMAHFVADIDSGEWRGVPLGRAVLRLKDEDGGAA